MKPELFDTYERAYNTLMMVRDAHSESVDTRIQRSGDKFGILYRSKNSDRLLTQRDIHNVIRKGAF